MAVEVQNPYQVFKDIDGTALDDGFIFVGEVGQDPEDFPIDVFWDRELTEPATGIRTKNGYPVNGTYPSRLYTNSEYSIKVKNKREIIVYAVTDSLESGGGSGIGGTTWVAGEEYPDEELVWHVPTQAFWESLIADNDVEPGTDPLKWVERGGLGSGEAVDISIADAGDYFTSTDVEGALQEIGEVFPTSPNDIDFNIGSVYEKAGSVATGEIALTDTRQILDPVAYPKLFARIGTTWGGDGITTFYLPSIQDVQGEKYDTGWIANSDWTNAQFIVNHNLGVGAGDICTKFYISETGVYGDEAREVGFSTNFTLGTGTYGYDIMYTDVDNLLIQTGVNGITILNSSGSTVGLDTEAWYYKVVVTKGYKELQDDMSLVIYVGNGSLSVVEDTSLDNRVTALENTLAVVEAPYDTGWIANSDWTTVLLTATHNFGAPYSDLSVELKISLDGTDDTAFTIGNETFVAAANTSRYGYTIKAVDENTVGIQTGQTGLFYYNTSSSPVTLPSAYYKIVVTKKASAPLIQTNFVPVKDWVEDKNFVPSGSPNVTYLLGEGLYKVTVDVITGGDIRESLISVDKSLTSCRFIWDDAYKGVYYTATGLWSVGHASYQVAKIEKWQDAVGQNRPMKAITDGYATVWEDQDYASGTKVLALEDGTYDVDYKFSNGAYSYKASFEINNASAISDAESPLNTATTGVYSYATKSITSGSPASYFPVRVRKAIGTVNLNVNQTNRTIAGVPNSYVFKKDTSAGDVTMVASDTWLPTDTGNTYPSVNNPLLVDGDLLIFYNSGLVVNNKLLKGLPRGYEQGADSSITFMYDGDNNDFIPQVPRMVRAEYENHGATITAGNPIRWTDIIEDTHNAYDGTTGIFKSPIDGVLRGVGALASANSVATQDITLTNITQATSKKIGGIDIPAANIVPILIGFSIRVSAGDEIKITSTGNTGSDTSNGYTIAFEISGN